MLSTLIKLEVPIVIKPKEIHEFPRHKLSNVNIGVKFHIQTNSNNIISFYFCLERDSFLEVYTIRNVMLFPERKTNSVNPIFNND